MTRPIVHQPGTKYNGITLLERSPYGRCKVRCESCGIVYDTRIGNLGKTVSCRRCAIERTREKRRPWASKGKWGENQ